MRNSRAMFLAVVSVAIQRLALMCVSQTLLGGTVLYAADALPTSTNSLGMQLVELPPGEFVMGEDNYNRVSDTHRTSVQVGQGFEDDRPALPVKLTRGFRIATHEVTVGQFRTFVAATGYQTDAEQAERGAFVFHPGVKNETGRFARDAQASWQQPGFEQDERHPVVCVSWHDTQAFCAWLSQREAAVYRLPSEAEWEYACRGGTKTIYSSGDNPDTLATHANVADAGLEAKFPGTVARQRADRLGAADSDGFVFTAPVGQLKPNPFGLFDLHGNVWEWCRDRYQDRLYAARQKELQELRRANKPVISVDPIGPETTPQHQYGDWRSLRGGSWYVSPISCRSATRSFAESYDSFSYLGFRVVCETP